MRQIVIITGTLDDEGEAIQERVNKALEKIVPTAICKPTLHVTSCAGRNIQDRPFVNITYTIEYEK